MSSESGTLPAHNNLRVFLETFGCQMNILDSELVAGKFKAAGHIFVDSPDKANVVLLNTCSVRELSEQKVLSRLGILKDRKENGEKLVVGVLGCMAERTHDELIKKRPYIDVLIGPSKIHDTLHLVESAFKEHRPRTKKSLSYFVKRKGLTESAMMSPLDDLEVLDGQRALGERKKPWQAYVRITRGCNKFCAFCVVPRTRGPELHRAPVSIMDEVKALVDKGAIEITLLGQTINHYFYDEGFKKWSFADLLFNLHEQIPALKRLRFLTSYPRDFTDDALDVMRACDRICKYLHIPAQSGSNKVLKEMNRGYDLDMYLNLIERAKTRMPNISLIGDMIVGYPNETEEDFLLSVDLLRKVRYKNVFIFKYSPRPDTTAFKNLVDNVPAEIKKLRNNAMLAVQNEITLLHHQAMVDQHFTILCEGSAKINREEEVSSSLVQLKSKTQTLLGRTTGDNIVHFRGSLEHIGKLIDVRVVKARPLSVDAVII